MSPVPLLRVDREVRGRWAAEPTPTRLRALVALELAHGLASQIQDERWTTARAEIEHLVLAGLNGLWRPPVDVAERFWARLAAEGAGRDAFDLSLAAGRPEAAAAIAERAGDERAELHLELAQRAGSPARGVGGLGALRSAWFDGDWSAVVRLADETSRPDHLAEAALLAAAALRRLGSDREARARLDRARAAQREALPALPFEHLVQHLGRWRWLLRETDLLEPTSWALPVPREGRQGPLGCLHVRRELAVVDEDLGPFRGRVLTRRLAGAFVPIAGADDIRFRAAAVRMVLRVAEVDAALAAFDRLDRAGPASGVVPSYRAEVLHWHGRTAEAAAACEEAIRREPSGRWAWIGLAQARMWEGDLAAAGRLLSTLQRRLPDLPTLPAVRGELALRLGQPERALPLLRRAVELHPSRRAAWLCFALALARTGAGPRAAAVRDAVQAAAPEAWLSGGPTLEAELAAQLDALRGNRSSSFVTVFPPNAPPLLLQGGHLLPTVPA